MQWDYVAAVLSMRTAVAHYVAMDPYLYFFLKLSQSIQIVKFDLRKYIWRQNYMFLGIFYNLLK